MMRLSNILQKIGRPNGEGCNRYFSAQLRKMTEVRFGIGRDSKTVKISKPDPRESQISRLNIPLEISSKRLNIPLEISSKRPNLYGLCLTYVLFLAVR